MKYKYSFLYYSLFFSILLATVSGVKGFWFFLFFVMIMTFVLLITRFIYGLLEKMGVKLYEKHIKDFIEKIEIVKTEIEE